ncbi:Nif3-like dinuclear metal center hexameric protein [Cohnella lubricantis]|uniref:GTP cyclohydrolase 1 type 2 homolog n=1 Tax=Cohnella lubricantis TaxID=2163172 RepID=A0A841T5Y8_9BACL|nr:Nif3-like dinuclear metal center hexameric protein [Cohnella lubricantis]MBB6676953.1 Nif3-like dinuclear metal center hexameric protein [Cohnella lubricantis]MBP2118358.1 putative NIF3 family GTP cyclohydrolase 1 type 2 [Cohnella lubricantis]
MKLTIRKVLKRLQEPITAEMPDSTVDKLITGEPDTIVTGIATAFMPSQSVIEQAIAMGANLLIAHEGLDYSHAGSAADLAADSVYLAKRRLIEQSGLAIYRFHDGIHRYRIDGITLGLIRTLGWEAYVSEHRAAASLLTLPRWTVRNIAKHLKQRLHVPFVRVVGDLDTLCECVGIAVGYRGGGATAIPLFGADGADLVIAGEGPEWETPEYVRDAVRQGKHQALILLGHAASEEPGMAELALTLQACWPGVPVRFLKDAPLFQWV